MVPEAEEKVWQYWVAHKNVPKFEMILYCPIIEFKQKNYI